jgi:hypothetical protein
MGIPGAANTLHQTSNPNISTLSQPSTTTLQGQGNLSGLAACEQTLDSMNSYQVISKNEYTPSAKAKAKRLQISKCQCQPSAESTSPNSQDKCVESCINKASNIDCDEATCALWGRGCRNSLISRLPNPDGVVETFTTERGDLGLKSRCDFDPQQPIIQYTGEVVTAEELVNKAYFIRQSHPNFTYEEALRVAKKYVVDFDVPRKLFLDAQWKGSPARFIDHSHKPNCTLQRHYSRGRLCFIICAGEGGVKKGDVLHFLYADEPDFRCDCTVCQEK